MTAVFVTGTGTGIGKTFVTTGLIRHFRGCGQMVCALKPVVSGFDPQNPSESDPVRLLEALEREVTPAELERISPWRFRAPLSPDMAARVENRAIDFRRVADYCRAAIAGSGGVLLIEGIGGIMVPLDERHTVLDLMAALGLPLILVGGSYLGTRQDLENVFRLLQEGVLRPHTQTHGLSETPALLDQMRRGALLGRAVIAF